MRRSARSARNAALSLLPAAVFAALVLTFDRPPPPQESLQLLVCPLEKVVRTRSGRGGSRADLVCRSATGSERIDAGHCRDQLGQLAPGAPLRVAWSPRGGVSSPRKKQAWIIEQGTSYVCSYADALAHRDLMRRFNLGVIAVLGAFCLGLELYRQQRAARS